MFDVSSEDQENYPRIKCGAIKCSSDSLINIYNEDEFSVILEGEIIGHSKGFLKILAVYLASFYVFNTAYPNMLCGTLPFIQKHLMKLGDSITPSQRF